MRWDEMSMSQKSEAIGLMVRNGITDIGTMKQMWDDMDGRKSPQQPPFAKRFEENPPRTIPTSQGNATHFMAADEAKGRYFAYPTVQPIDYKNDRSPLKYYGDRALDRALENNDVMEFKTLEDAIRYSENYKRPPSTGAYLNNEFHPLYSPYDYVRSFAEGGSSNIPPERFFGIAAPEVTDNTLYQPSYGTLLPEVNVKAKGDPRKINNDYYKAHAVERAGFEDRVANRVDQGWVPQTMIGLASVPLDVEGVVGLRLLYEQLPKWVLNVPKNPNRYYRIVDKRAIDDYISSGKIRSAQAAKEAGVDTEGPKQAGRILLKKNHDYNMFSKGEPWQGGLAIRDKNKPYILVSKENTGKTIWEQSNVDFRHKGHSGIYRPRYEGDLNATPSIYFDYYKPRLIGYTKHSFDDGGSIDDPPDKKPAIPVGGYLPDYYPSQQEWLRNWFGNREEQIKDNFKGIALGVSGFDPSRSIPIQYVERAIDGSMKVPVKYQSIFNDPDNPTSAYNKETGQIFIDPNMQDIESTLLHERTHALNHQLPQRVVGQQGYEMSPIESKVRDVMMPWYKENKQDLDEYWDDPVEIYARMMQMRYRLNLDPTKKVTKEELNKWRKDGLLRQYEMGVYDDDTLLQLFNEVADNRQLQNNQRNTYVIPTDIGLGYV